MRAYVVRVALLLAIIGVTAHGTVLAQEVIQFRTGQVGGAPGSCPGADDLFTYNPSGMTPCGNPFRAAPFTAADFAGAAGGPPARVLNGGAPWLPSLPSDPLARWINWENNPNCAYGTPKSVLYAARFNVTTQCNPVATVRICWAVDDRLGDGPGGPNPVGIYMNGVPLSAGFMNGSYASETCFVEANVPVNTGLNYLYVYQRDAGCAVSGLILTAHLTVTATTCPTIAAHKFNDLNGNGVQDGGEADLSGWQVNISGPVTQSATTGANGVATFPCVPPGTYFVTEVTQPGWIQSTPSGGVHVVNATCGNNYAVEFGNRRCEQGQAPCVPLPSCLSAWWPFNECAGVTANDVVANRDGLIQGGVSNPTWSTGRWGSPCGLRIPGLPGTQVVTIPDSPEHDFGTGSFTIFAWVRTTNNDGTIRTILDKRVPPLTTPTGYVLYHVNGVLSFQYNDGVGAATTHTSTAPAFNDGNWHTVAVSVCRNPNNPAANAARLIVDGHVDTFTGGIIPTGSLSNAAGLQFGDQCPGFIPGTALNGAIDDVLLFKCCLTPQQVAALRTDFEYCTDGCYVPQNGSTPFGFGVTSLTLCNYSLTPQTYAWTISGLPAGPGCSVNGPTGFVPMSGTVTVPPATGGPSCVSVPIVVSLPAGMVAGQTTCYQVTTQNLTTGRCCVTKGRIRKTSWWLVQGNPSAKAMVEGVEDAVRFKVKNESASSAVFDYRIRTQSADGDDANQIVGLDGLPPGEPVFGSVAVPAGQTVEVVVNARMLGFQPLNVHEVVLDADSDGDGELEAVGTVALRSVTEQQAAGAPEPDVAPAFPRAEGTLAVFPNPTRGGTGIRVDLAAPQSRVRIEVFDVAGRLVRTVHDGSLGAGPHTFDWNGRDEADRTLGSGLYLVRARLEEGTLETKLIRLE